MNKVIHKNEYFVLTKERHRKNPTATHWRIAVKSSPGSTPSEIDEFLESVRDMVDPNRNRSGHHGRHWKYRTQELAEKDFTMLTLRWS